MKSLSQHVVIIASSVVAFVAMCGVVWSQVPCGPLVKPGNLCFDYDNYCVEGGCATVSQGTCADKDTGQPAHFDRVKQFPQRFLGVCQTTSNPDDECTDTCHICYVDRFLTTPENPSCVTATLRCLTSSILPRRC